MRKKTKGQPTKTDIQIGKNLKTIRLFRGMSQEHLGAKIGITFQQIQKYEKGTNRISGGRFVDISNALDVPVTALFEGTGHDETLRDVPSVSKRQENILTALVQLNNSEIEKSFLQILKNQLKNK